MLPLLLVLAFLVMPVLEIFVIIQVGGVIGAWPTVALLVAESLLGGWIVRREGRRAWRTLEATLRRGVMPDREIADAALILAGGVLLLTPGFVTDVFGFAFVLPVTRPLVRRALSRYASRRVRASAHHDGIRTRVVFPPGFGRAQTPPGPVVRGEVVDDVTEGDDSPSRA
ncbi:FxsA family protein [Actinomadura spongiicola]|uniref:FxsA family protein n=1 Tax=Actinomadura spongiicola TaxID=2303421 RepID=A0A372GEY8_9ACTN|nr:FxsA family protein [Actinomadura spongiicola]RFS83910.1 FxsA family protein [Actinomadura spongiicola]